MLKEYIKMLFFTQILRNYLESWFKRDLVSTHMPWQYDEPCPMWIDVKRTCKQPAQILAVVKLNTGNGRQVYGSKKLCLKCASENAVRRLLEQINADWA